MLLPVALPGPSPQIISFPNPEPPGTAAKLSHRHHHVGDHNRLGGHRYLSDHIFAIATFDANGILERSEFRADYPAQPWTQAVFSAIGFKGLLDASLHHQGFRYAKITGDQHVAFLVRRHRRYVALLSTPLNSWEDEVALRQCLVTMGTGDLLALLKSQG